MVKRKSVVKSILFFLLIMAILVFCLFPFGQMLSLSLKYSWDWGNPSWIPSKVNLEAYKELLNIGFGMFSGYFIELLNSWILSSHKSDKIAPLTQVYILLLDACFPFFGFGNIKIKGIS